MTRQPIRIEVSAGELAQLEQLRVVKRWDFPACFSTNGRELWPFRTFSFTRPEYRVDVRGTLPLLDEIADWFVHVRPSGGRFFVSDKGAFFKPELLELEQFLAFRAVLGAPRRRRPPVPGLPMPPGARDWLEHLAGRCVSKRCRPSAAGSLRRRLETLRSSSTTRTDTRTEAPASAGLTA